MSLKQFFKLGSIRPEAFIESFDNSPAYACGTLPVCPQPAKTAFFELISASYLSTSTRHLSTSSFGEHSKTSQTSTKH